MPNLLTAATTLMHTIMRKHLKMIGKGFVLFEINSSSSAFYIIKPTCISWLVFKVNKCLKNYRKLPTLRFVFVAEWWRHLSGRIQTSSLFVPRVPLDVVSVVLSLIIMPSDKIDSVGLFTVWFKTLQSYIMSVWHQRSVARIQPTR